MAQSVIVVDSEKIFKSIGAYTSAIEQLEVLSKSYQMQVDAKFAAVESAFNSYATNKASYSTTSRQQLEASILKQEAEATKLQEEIFGEDGKLMKQRLELIAPIQKRVFETIDSYAKEIGAKVVLDKASNPTMLYVAAGVDKTEAVIAKLK